MWRGLRLTSSCLPVRCCCVAAQCVSNKRPRVVVRSADVARLEADFKLFACSVLLCSSSVCI